MPTCSPRVKGSPPDVRRLSRQPRRGLALLLVLALLPAGGCQLFGWVAKGAGLDQRKVNIPAEYTGLRGKRVAVVVNADQATYFEHPAAALRITRAVSQRLRADVPDIGIINPDDIDRFQRQNPYWHTLQYGELTRRLGVERLVYIDLIDFTLRERGNAHIWKGQLLAQVGVAEADGPAPDKLAYLQSLRTEFPPDQPVGVVNSDDATIEAGMLAVFAQQVANLFRDHKGVEERW